jgi:hypothetical protein
MTTARTPCPSFGELADYWTSDITPDAAEQIETHVFDCERCARMLADADRLRAGILTLARSGNIQAFVTDDVLNRLARDGVRVRYYALSPGESVRCAVWSDDDVLVTRLRGDFAGVESIDAEMPLVRSAPTIPMRLTLRASDASRSERILAEYVFDHQGAIERSST